MDVHQVLGLGAESIMKNSLNRRSLDNVTVVIVAFSGFKDTITSLNSQHQSQTDKENSNMQNTQPTASKIPTNTLNNMQRGHPKRTNLQGIVKSQRSASQNQVLGESRGLLKHKTLI